MSMRSATAAARRGSIADVVGYFLRLGAVGFGGPVALCGQMEKDLVHDKAWLTRDEMPEAIAISQSMPGPLAIQVGIFISYMRGGFWRAWAGGWAFILPSFLVVAARRGLCAFRRPAMDDGDFLWRESGDDRADRSFLLAPVQVAHG